jgi:hypothetical protein
MTPDRKDALPAKHSQGPWLHAIPRSYWQRGCNDAFHGKPLRPPNPGAGPFDLENSGYYSGWNFGAAKRATQGEA